MIKISNVKNTIIQGETVETLRQFPDKSIDCIFADPPYFMQTEGTLLRTEGTAFQGVDDDWDKFSSYNEYDQFCFEWLKECQRVLKDKGSIWVIGSFQNVYRLGYIMQELGFWILNDVIWEKSNPAPNFRGTRLTNAHETMLWCTKNKKASYTFNYQTMKFLNGNKQERSVWNIPLCTGNERLKDKNGKKLHATQKPEKLLEKVILSSTKPGDLILDPFMGTGTTAAVATQLARNFVGIEREEKYVKAATERVKAVPYVTNDPIMLASLDVKKPRVPIERLIEAGMLKERESLFDKFGGNGVVLKTTGCLDDGDSVLSIHKMSAKKLGKTNHNGWDYWFVKRGDDLVSINEFRENYREQFENE